MKAPMPLVPLTCPFATLFLLQLHGKKCRGFGTVILEFQAFQGFCGFGTVILSFQVTRKFCGFGTMILLFQVDWKFCGFVTVTLAFQDN